MALTLHWSPEEQSYVCRESGRGSEDSNGKQVHGVHLKVPYQLQSADGLRYPFSNYVRGYTGLLDYVWFEPDRLEVQA